MLHYDIVISLHSFILYLFLLSTDFNPLKRAEEERERKEMNVCYFFDAFNQ